MRHDRRDFILSLYMYGAITNAIRISKYMASSDKHNY
jgi:hypothetical protein